MSSYPAVFMKRVGDFAAPPPPSVRPDDTCAATVAAIADAGSTSAIVVDGNGRPVGIVTEQDIARRMVFRADPDTPIARVMTTPVLTEVADEFAYHAIARMRRADLRHMPVVDGCGTLTGMLHLGDALAAASDQLVGHIDRLTHADTPEGIRAVKAAQVEVAQALLDDAIPATDILALLSHVNRDIHRRLADRALAEMRDAGLGDPPVPFAVIVMGSAGRGESLLHPDQDNGLILADYPDAEHDRIDAYFIAFAERLTRALDDVGFPYCNGQVMATNPVWRKTLPQWRAQIDYWGRKRGAAAVLLSDIFFDFRAACGDTALAAPLRDHVTAVMRRNHPFLQALFDGAAEMGTALGLFGRLRVERAPGPHRGRLNLKHAGTLPLVASVRLLALSEGIAAVSTLDRLDALREAGVFNADRHDELTGAYRHIVHLMLRQQLADFNSGQPVGNHVAPRGMSRRERALLVDSLGAIDALRDRVRTDFTGDIF